jgi:hypothetical protein
VNASVCVCVWGGGGGGGYPCKGEMVSNLVSVSVLLLVFIFGLFVSV